MRTLLVTLLLVLFVVLTTAPATTTTGPSGEAILAPAPVNSEVNAKAFQTDRTVRKQELAIGPWKNPCPSVCCEMRRETRKCVRYCCPGLTDSDSGSLGSTANAWPMTTLKIPYSVATLVPAICALE